MTQGMRLTVLVLCITAWFLTACQQQPVVEPTVRPTITPTPEPTPTGQPTEPAASAFAGSRSFARQTVVLSPKGEVVIGLAAALSGDGLGALGQDILRGAELALMERPLVTLAGQQFRVVLNAQDDRCSTDGGQVVANRFAADQQVIAVVGPMCSSSCRPAARIFDAAGFTTISPSCTAPDLTMRGYAGFNRTIASDSLQGIIAAEYIFRSVEAGGLGVTRIATIHDGSAYGEGLVAVMSQRFRALGGQVVNASVINVGETDFRALLEDIGQAVPELIYFAGFPSEAARIADQRVDVGLENILFMGADGIRTQQFIDLAGRWAENTYASVSLPPESDALQAFLSLYVQTYGEAPPAPFHASAYDATHILLDAIEASARLDADGRVSIDRAAVRDYVRTLTGYQGLTGILNADGTGELSIANIGIAQVRSGIFVDVAVGRFVAGNIVLRAAGG